MKTLSFINLRRVTLFFVALIYVLAFVAIAPVKALSEEQRRLFNKNVLYYDIETCSAVASSADTGGSTAADAGSALENAKIIYSFLVGRGLTKDQAAGILANLYSESGINPKRVQGAGVIEAEEITVDNQTGYGLAQWTSQNRQQGLKDAAEKAGKKSSDLGVQINFLWKELTTSYRTVLADLKRSNTYLEATSIIINDFEAPKVRNTEERITNFKFIYDQLPDAGTIPTGAGNVGDAQDLYMVGDSITFQTKEDLAKAYKSKGFQEVNINASGGRSILTAGSNGPQTSGMQAIEDDRGVIKDAEVVVVALGTNPNNGFEGSVKDLVKKVKEYNQNAKIYWVNVFSTGGFARPAEYNPILKKIESPNTFSIIDTTGKNIPTTDDIHPTSEGEKIWINTITDALGGATATSASADGSCTCNAPSSGDTAKSIKIKDAAKKNNLHSAAVMEVGGEMMDSDNADKAPNTPASTMKLVIVDTVLRGNIDLDKSISVSNEILYDGSNDLGVSSITVRDAITKTLSRSSNVGANALMKSLGGVEEFTKKANGFGYKGTEVKAYYSSSARGKNKSTIEDQVKAMSNIFDKNGAGYKVAQSASKNAANSDNHYGVTGPVANKWAGTSTVAGNVALFEVNGAQYVVGVYVDNSEPAAPADNKIKSGTADIKALIQDSAGSGSSGDCGTTAGTGNGAAIAEWAVKMAWPESRGLVPKPEYKEAVQKYNSSRISMLADCGTFVSTAVLASKADTKFPPGYTPTMEEYVRSNPDKWDVLDKVDKITDLEPGDVMIVNQGIGDGGAGHTYIYVGKQDPKGYDAASASLNSRTGNLGPTDLADSRGNYLRARLK